MENEYNFYEVTQKFGPYYGKYFSVLGDSISTMQGFNPECNSLFYSGKVCDRAMVYNYIDTWWGKTIENLAGIFLANDSWSGSMVTKNPNRPTLFPSACSDERTSKLHVNGIMPDVILIYIGINDWANGIIPRYDMSGTENEYEYFDIAYDTMLKKLKSNYPLSEIWCGTICSSYISENPRFVFPKVYRNQNIDDFNAVIRERAVENGCYIMDLAMYNLPYNSIDGTHPAVSGMETISSLAINEIKKALT